MCFKPRVCELPDRLIACDNYEFTNWEIGGLCATKHISDHQSLDLWELTHELLALNLSPFISPTYSLLYPARHIPSFRRAVVSLLLLPFPLTSPPSEGLGEAPLQAWGGSFSLVLGRFSFLSSALLLSISFLSVFPSTPFCVVKDALLQCKRASFDV